MKTPQFKHAKDILIMLEGCINHTNLKWQLYQSLGYLPATNTFNEMLEILDERQADIDSAEAVIEGDPSYADSLTIERLYNLRNFLHYDIKDLSDMVCALDHVFFNRLVGIVAHEPTLGTEVISRPFGGTQLIYNATESLMKDYVENIEEVHLFSWDKVPGDDSAILLRYLNNHHGVNWVDDAKISKSDEKTIRLDFDENSAKIMIDKAGKKATLKINGARIHDLKVKNKRDGLNIYEYFGYDGLVVFGFDNRAVSYPPLVHYPSYAEHDLEYLLILAHEAYHLLRPKVGVSEDAEEKLRSIQSALQEVLTEIAPLYTPETIKDVKVPHELTTAVLADELMADIYATIVGGESYPKILCDYYLPIMLDTSAEPKHSAFTIGSLKIRVAVTALKAMDWNDGPDHIQNIIKEVEGKIKEWEERSVKIALDQFDRAGLENLGFYGLRNKLDRICKRIEDEKIPARMMDVIERPYYPKDKGEREKLRKKIEEVTKILTGDSITLEDMAIIWAGGRIRPRHLISLVAHNGTERNSINRNAILLLLGYHKNILDRFTSQSGDF